MNRLATSLFASVGLALSVEAQVQEVWRAYYNGPGSAFGNNYDRPVAVVVDDEGSLYVTGSSDGTNGMGYPQFATIKYANNGAQQWVARYGEPDYGPCTPQSLAVNSSHQVYVVGHFSDAGGRSKIATVKYDTDGTQLWVRIHGITSEETSRALALDTAGNCFIAGVAYGSNVNSFLTVKYDPAGVLAWETNYADPAACSDEPNLLSVQTDGTVLVTGTSVCPTERNYLGVAYNSDGHLLRAIRYIGGTNPPVSLATMALDAAGNLYIVGRIYYDVYNHDIGTAKYGADGILRWVRHYDGPVHSYDYGKGVAVDSAGNVYVMGQSSGRFSHEGDEGMDYVTIKYDPDGREQWVARYNGPADDRDDPRIIKLDQSGNVFVSGYACSMVSYEIYATLKYDAQGQRLCVMSTVGPAFYDEPTAMTLDATGNVYVTGEADAVLPSARTDYLTVKYGQFDAPGRPVITAPPLDQAAVAGSNVTFSVSAAGDPPLFYRWRCNGQPMFGKTNSVLVFSNSQPRVAGEYSVEVSNMVGTAASPEARLTFATRFTGATREINGEFGITFAGDGGAYALQVSTDLATWSTLTNLAGVPTGVYGFSDSSAVNRGASYYRLVR